MVLFDAAILSLAIDRKSRIPSDFRTGNPIPQARERVDALIDSLEKDGEVIVIPAPALAEALTTLADKAIELTEQIENKTCFRIKAFGKREAIEVAIRTHNAILAGDKREGIDSPWQKVKYDRQIVACAAVEGVTAIYSSDKGVHEHAKLWGIPALHLADVPLPAGAKEQKEMFDEQRITETETVPTSADIRRSGDEPAKNQATTEGEWESEGGATTQPEERKPESVQSQARTATVGAGEDGAPEADINLDAELKDDVTVSEPTKSKSPASEKLAGDAKDGS